MSVDGVFPFAVKEEHAGLGVLVGFLDEDMRLGLHAFQGSEASVEGHDIEALQLLGIEVGDAACAIDDILLTEVFHALAEDGREFLPADLGTADGCVGESECHGGRMLNRVRGCGRGTAGTIALNERSGGGADKEVFEVIEISLGSIGLFPDFAIEYHLDAELPIALLDFETDEVPDTLLDGIGGGDSVVSAGELIKECQLSIRIHA